jgi:hypothetical protein
MEESIARRSSLGNPQEKLAPAATREDFYRVLGRDVHACVERLREEDAELGRVLERSEERWPVSSRTENQRAVLAFASKVFGIYDCCFDDDRRSLSVDALPSREEYVDDPLLGVARVCTS